MRKKVTTKTPHEAVSPYQNFQRSIQAKQDAKPENPVNEVNSKLINYFPRHKKTPRQPIRKKAKPKNSIGEEPEAPIAAAVIDD